ncbi:DUF3152 domain-containing protein [Streptomyces sp. NPDC051218]|uniref:DUF3152 domain-containing protein n=1 Tax=Streptomyces sp. NPDC051218 TaxID=3365645 RepID=UPI00379AE37A
MGRHSRRGSADLADNTGNTNTDDIPSPQGARPPAPGTGRRRRAPGDDGTPAHGFPQATPSHGVPRATPAHGGPQGTPPHGMPQGTPPHGFPQATPPHGIPEATPAHGFPQATPSHGVPRAASARGGSQGTPSHGTPQGAPPHGFPQATPPHGIPQATPAHGTPQATPAHGSPQGTPPHGTPHATPSHGVPHVRGGHPEQREPGEAWGAGPRLGASYGAPGVRPAPPRMPGPRREYVDAFSGEFADEDLFGGGASRPSSMSADAPPRDPYASVTDWDRAVDEDEEAQGALWADAADRADGVDEADGVDSFGPDGPGGFDDGDGSDSKGGGKGRAFTGIAAAAVTTVLAIVVAGQVTDGPKDSAPRPQAAKGQEKRAAGGDASRSDDRPTPPESAPATYETKMAKKYPLDAKLTSSGDFDAMAGFDKAPGKGQLFRYRVDVEKGMGLDGELFASAVQKTLNDERSWAHGGGRTFERISSGRPDFVITLASPGTTAKWCAKSGLDTMEQNVSCDSAATDRVMINAYRWAQGAKTYGDRIHPYRQMLINHEVGHRLGFNHTDCTKDGELAPVMQQQTKFLDHDGIKCKANPWAFPKS